MLWDLPLGWALSRYGKAHANYERLSDHQKQLKDVFYFWCKLEITVFVVVVVAGALAYMVLESTEKIKGGTEDCTPVLALLSMAFLAIVWLFDYIGNYEFYFADYQRTGTPVTGPTGTGTATA